MAKQRLFPERPEPDGQTRATPHERFAKFAASVVRVPKSEVDQREREWKQGHSNEPPGPRKPPVSR